MEQVKSPITRLNPVSLPEGRHRHFLTELSIPGVLPFALTVQIDTLQDDLSPLGRLHSASTDETIRDGTKGGYRYLPFGAPEVSFAKPDPHPGAQSRNAGRPDLALEPLQRGGLRLRQGALVRDYKRFRNYHLCALYS